MHHPHTLLPAPLLVVFTGPMFSEKSAELIRYMRMADHAGLNPLLLKPAKDTRDDECRSRNGSTWPSKRFSGPDQLLTLARDARVIGLDEAQFADPACVEVILELVRGGRSVYVAGLDLDFLERPFPVIRDLMPHADKVIKLAAVCACCRQRPATRSRRLVEGDQQILVGDGEYEPLCLTCYIERTDTTDLQMPLEFTSSAAS